MNSIFMAILGGCGINGGSLFYPVVSLVVGIICLYEFIRAVIINLKIKKNGYRNLPMAAHILCSLNKVLLFLLFVREVLDFIFWRELCLHGTVSIILRIVPPLIYVYMQKIAVDVLFNTNVGEFRNNHKEKHK
jgi:hypothetical protein